MSNTNHEDAVLGIAICHGKSAVDMAVEAGIDENCFTGDYERVVAARIWELYRQDKPIDIVTVPDGLDIPQLIIMEWIDAAPVKAHITYHALQVKHEKKRREGLYLISSAQEKLKNAPLDDTTPIIEELRNSLFAISTSEKEHSEINLWELAAHEIDKAITPGTRESLISWPIDAINMQLGRVSNEIIWIVARPSLGKSVFVNQWQVSLGRHGRKNAMAQLESSASSYAQRLLTHISGVPFRKLTEGRASQDEIEKVREANETLKLLPIYVEDTPKNIEQLYAWGVKEAENGADILFIDNCRHIRRPQAWSKAKGWEWHSYVSLRIKQLRDDTGIPVVAVHHENRQDEIAGTDDIRKDADIIIFLKDADEGKVRLQFDKWRENSRGDSFLLDFDKHGLSFRFSHGYDVDASVNELRSAEAWEPEEFKY